MSNPKKSLMVKFTNIMKTLSDEEVLKWRKKNSELKSKITKNLSLNNEFKLGIKAAKSILRKRNKIKINDPKFNSLKANYMKSLRQMQRQQRNRPNSKRYKQKKSLYNSELQKMKNYRTSLQNTKNKATANIKHLRQSIKANKKSGNYQSWNTLLPPGRMKTRLNAARKLKRFNRITNKLPGGEFEP